MWNQVRPEDFGVRALWRANGKYPIVNVDRQRTVVPAEDAPHCCHGGFLKVKRRCGVTYISIAIMRMISKRGARNDTAFADFFASLYYAAGPKP